MEEDGRVRLGGLPVSLSPEPAEGCGAPIRATTSSRNLPVNALRAQPQQTFLLTITDFKSARPSTQTPHGCPQELDRGRTLCLQHLGQEESDSQPDTP